METSDRRMASRARHHFAGQGVTAAGAVAVAAILLLANAIAGPLAAQQAGPSGMPLPRFASLKSNPVNLRTGPGRQYPKAWVFRRAGLPVEIIQEHRNWRRVRDSEGSSGWILGALLSRRRTALVMPWEKRNAQSQRKFIDLKANARADARAIARLETGALASIRTCDGRWCQVTAGDFAGYLEQNALWGVYPDETIE
jgi:SH3-like domain-containing protein